MSVVFFLGSSISNRRVGVGGGGLNSLGKFVVAFLESVKNF